VLGRSLTDDPIFQWAFGGVAAADDIAEFAATLYAPLTELGMVWLAGNDTGVAVWVPPGSQVAVDSSEEAWAWIESFVPSDTWYLEVLSVDPEAQGAGIGGALVRHGLDLAAAEGAGVFLETSVARNVPYYERFGFVVVAEEDMPRNGPHVWFMRVD
jgi:GNAT superfamily N-acetyltransferase